MLLNNATLAAVLAVIALLFGYVCRSPAYRHAAWVIVLLKLVTPPLFTVAFVVLPASWQSVAGSPSCAFEMTRLVSVPDLPRGITPWLLGVWGCGSVGWFALQTLRIVRFRRGVQLAADAPADVTAATNQLAVRLGIANPPRVKLGVGIGSPMLWGWCRNAVVLFPAELLKRLSPEARDTLLAHELAHHLRRDHWVRVLEFVATGLFWWHPIVWLARREIEASEEICCDAWVVGGLSASPRLYAEALLATVDFDAELRRPCFPPGACAASHTARLLHRRLIAIIHADRPHQVRCGIWLRTLATLALLTQPVLRTMPLLPCPVSQPEPLPEPHPVQCTESPSQSTVPIATMPRIVTPPSWASATAPITGVAVLACDREVILYRPNGEMQILGPGRPLALAFSPDEQTLTTVGPDALVRSWNDRGVIAEVRTRSAARSVVYTPDGTAILVLDADGRISQHDAKTLATVAEWNVDGPANSIACSADGKTLAVSFGSWLNDTGWVECWSIATRQKTSTFRTPMPVGACRFAPDGTTLIVGGWNGTLLWLGLPSGTVIAQRQLPKQVVANTAFSPDARTLPIVPPPLAPPPIPIDPNLVPFEPSRTALNRK